MKLLFEILILSVLYQVSVLITTLLEMPIPPVLIGMGLLFLLLVTGVIRPKHMDRSSQFFSRHLFFFFIPVVVGILPYWEVMKQGGWYLVITVIISTTVVLLSTAFVTMLFKEGEKM